MGHSCSPAPSPSDCPLNTARTDQSPDDDSIRANVVEENSGSPTANNESPSTTTGPATAQSTNDASPRHLEVYVTGDIFYERYLWPIPTDPAQGYKHSPFTSPDELRSSGSTGTIAELSGAYLHRSIFHKYLDAFKHKTGLPYTFAVKLIPEVDPTLLPPILGDSPASGLGIDLFLHELGSFPAIDLDWTKDATLVWRIARSFGRVEPSAGRHVARTLDLTSFCNLLTRKDDKAGPTVIVINDRNLRFRRCINAYRSDIINARSYLDSTNQLIIWHVSHAFSSDSSRVDGANPIADIMAMSPGLRARTIPILTHQCLRDDGLALRFDNSYESTLRTLLSSREHPLVARLLGFPHVLIRFDYGVLHLQSHNGELKGLDVHALNSGPYYFNVARHGATTGHTPLLVSAILGEIAAFVAKTNASLIDFINKWTKSEHPTFLHNTRLDRAIDAGILLGSRHFRRGYAPFNAYSPLTLIKCTTPVYEGLIDEFMNNIDDAPFRTPESTDLIRPKRAASLREGPVLNYRHPAPIGTRLTRLSVPSSLLERSPSVPNWRNSMSRVELLTSPIVTEGAPFQTTSKLSPRRAEQAGPGHFDVVLRKVVQVGLDRVLTCDAGGDNPQDLVSEPSVFCPYVSFGPHLSIDFAEIDSFLALRYLVEKYVGAKEWNRPLAVAVFGGPGSGKGFLVNEVLKSVPLCSFDETLTCNLSQLVSASDLSRQFHKIQDRAQKGELPIAFFDEFDAPHGDVPLGWLKHFLMPLQDGMYMDGNDCFQVGRAIFVFAGGTSHTFEDFCTVNAERVREKVPDFVSRLRCYVDVEETFLPKASKSDRIPDGGRMMPAARAGQVRRAIILRSLLFRKMRQIFDPGSRAARIDNAIVDAFVNVSRFTHGVRSMEAIIEMSRVPASSSAAFVAAALPSEAQLRMHVDPDEFMAYVRGDVG